MPITPGRVAWYVTGRFYLDPQGRLQDLGYFLHLEGVQGSLFNPGTMGEATARLTFRSAPFKSEPITNGNGVTQWGAMNADPLATFPPYTRIAAFTGSAVAAG